MLNIRYTNPLHTYVGYELANGEFHNPPAEKFAEDNPGITPAPYAPPAITWADIRSKRDGLLAETDWVVVKAQEVGEAVPAAWVTYRQALRDLPANTADPANPVWPSAP